MVRRQIPSSRFCEKEPIYLLCNLFSLQCMLRALLIFVLGTKYTHPFSETQGLGFPRAGWGWAPGLRDHTKGARTPPRPGPPVRVRLQGPSAPPLQCPPSLLRASLLIRGQPENPERTGPGGGACSVAGRFSLLVGSSSATPAAAAAAAVAAAAFPRSDLGLFPAPARFRTRGSATHRASRSSSP